MPSTIYKYNTESGNLLSITASIPWTPEAQEILDGGAFTRTVSTGEDYYTHVDEDLEFTVGIAITGTTRAIKWLEKESKHSWRKNAVMMNANH